MKKNKMIVEVAETNLHKMQNLLRISREDIDYIREVFDHPDIDSLCRAAMHSNYQLTEFLISLIPDEILKEKTGITKYS